MKCFEKVCGNLWVPESDEIIFDGMEAEDIDTTIPDCAFVNDGSMQGKMIDNHRNTLMLQTKGVVILFPSVKHYLYAIRCQIN